MLTQYISFTLPECLFMQNVFYLCWLSMLNSCYNKLFLTKLGTGGSNVALAHSDHFKLSYCTATVENLAQKVVTFDKY